MSALALPAGDSRRGLLRIEVARVLASPLRLLPGLLLVAGPPLLALLISVLLAEAADVRNTALDDVGHQLKTATTGFGAAGFILLGAAPLIADRANGFWTLLLSAQVDRRSCLLSKLLAAMVAAAAGALAIGALLVLLALVRSGAPDAGSLFGGLALLLVAGAWWVAIGWAIAARSRSWRWPGVAAFAINVLTPAFGVAADQDGPWQALPPVAIARSAGAPDTLHLGVAAAGVLISVALLAALVTRRPSRRADA